MAILPYTDSSMGVLPNPRKLAFRQWYLNRRKYIYNYCNQPRVVNYYVSQTDGSDSYDGLSPTHTIGATGPKKTIAGLLAISGLAALASVGIYFKRGDSWVAEKLNISFTNSAAKVTVGNYGDPAKPLPIISQMKYLDSATNVSGTYYTMAVTGSPSSIGYVDYSEAQRSDQLIKVANSTTVSTTPKSWWYGSGTLHINYPKNPNYWARYSVATVPCINLPNAVDTYFVYGITTESGTTETETYNIYVNGATNAVLIDNCEAYYYPKHGVGIYSSASGGVSMISNCRGGWGSTTNADNNSLVVIYHGDGGGEWYMSGNVQQYGNARGVTRGSDVLLSHCKDTSHFPLISFVEGNRLCADASNLANVNTGFGSNNSPPPAATLADCRSFLFDNVAENGSISASSNSLVVADTASFNNKFVFTPVGTSGYSYIQAAGAGGEPLNGWAWNNEVLVDLRVTTDGLISFFGAKTTNAAWQVDFSTIIFKSTTNYPVGNNVPNWNGAGVYIGIGGSATSLLTNSVFGQIDSAGTVQARLDKGNDNINGNAYVGLSDKVIDPGISNDLAAKTLPIVPAFGKSVSTDITLVAADLSAPELMVGGLPLEYDANWTRRSSTTSIGAYASISEVLTASSGGGGGGGTGIAAYPPAG